MADGEDEDDPGGQPDRDAVGNSFLAIVAGVLAGLAVPTLGAPALVVAAGLTAYGLATLPRGAKANPPRSDDTEVEATGDGPGDPPPLQQDQNPGSFEPVGAGAKAEADPVAAEAKAKAEADAEADRIEAEAKTEAEAKAKAEADYYDAAFGDLKAIGPMVRQDLSMDRTIAFKEWQGLKAVVDAAEIALKDRKLDALTAAMDVLRADARIGAVREKVAARELAQSNAPKPFTASTVGAATFTLPVPGNHRSGTPFNLNAPENLEPRVGIVLRNREHIARPDGTPPNSGDQVTIGDLAFSGGQWLATATGVVAQTPMKRSDEIHLGEVVINRAGGRIETHRPWADTLAILRRHAGAIEASAVNQTNTGWIYKVFVDSGDALFDHFPNDPRPSTAGRDNIAFEFDPSTGVIRVFHSGRSS